MFFKIGKAEALFFYFNKGRNCDGLSPSQIGGRLIK